MTKIMRWLPFLLIFAMAYLQGTAQTKGLREASGITRQGDDLLLVGDEDAGVYYRFHLLGDRGPIFPIDSLRLTQVELSRANLAIDLESIDLLGDARIVVLSERLRSLVGENGIIAEYDNPLCEFGNRGLEGLAVRQFDDGSSRIAVLWEGGYPEFKDVPAQLQELVGRLPMLPVLWIHDLKAGKSKTKIRLKDKDMYALRVVQLKVPKPPGEEPAVLHLRFGQV